MVDPAAWVLVLPGPARWGLGTSLALAILAGKGFDALWFQSGWTRPGRSLVRFAVAAGLAIGVVVAGWELALAAGRGATWEIVEEGFALGLRALPWRDADDALGFRATIQQAYQPQGDTRVLAALARTEGKPPGPPGPSLAGSRGAIYRQELAATGLMLAALIGASRLARKRKLFAAVLVALAGADALAQARHRPFDLGPARSLIGQSPVLARLAQEPRSTRTLDPAQNLFLVAGVNAVAAYRTLDLPAPTGLLALARGSAADPRTAEALRAVGVGVRVFDPFESRKQTALTPAGWEVRPGPIADPALAGWLYGVDLTRALGDHRFTLVRPQFEPAQAWLFPTEPPETARGMADPAVLLAAFRAAVPLPCRSESPERAEVEVRIGHAGSASVVLARTFDPEWRAFWTDSDGQSKRGEVVRVFGGWQGVAVPGPGRWTLHLQYDGRAARLGLFVSSLAWTVWSVVTLRIGGGRTEPRGADS